jgi:hypothetical protein
MEKPNERKGTDELEGDDLATAEAPPLGLLLSGRRVVALGVPLALLVEAGAVLCADGDTELAVAEGADSSDG